MSKPLHPAFLEYLRRNRAHMSREAFDAGVLLARWVAVMESGHARPDAKRYADEAARKFKELLDNGPARTHDA